MNGVKLCAFYHRSIKYLCYCLICVLLVACVNDTKIKADFFGITIPSDWQQSTKQSKVLSMFVYTTDMTDKSAPVVAIMTSPIVADKEIHISKVCINFLKDGLIEQNGKLYHKSFNDFDAVEMPIASGDRIGKLIEFNANNACWNIMYLYSTPDKDVVMNVVNSIAIRKLFKSIVGIDAIVEEAQALVLKKIGKSITIHKVHAEEKTIVFSLTFALNNYNPKQNYSLLSKQLKLDVIKSIKESQYNSLKGMLEMGECNLRYDYYSPQYEYLFSYQITADDYLSDLFVILEDLRKKLSKETK